MQNLTPRQDNSVECIRCLYTNRHPFGLGFDGSGLCTGCITHAEKFNLDWAARFERLAKLASSAKKDNPSPYDCVVPIRGTPEYFYVMHVVKNVLGLRPLAVSFNSHFNSRVGVINTDRIREKFDVDIHAYAPNELVYRKVVRESLYRFHNLRLPYIAGETSFPIRVASQLHIPLVIWPYHQPTEQVGMHSYEEEPEFSFRGREEFDLAGLSLSDLVSAPTTLTADDVADFEYPTPSQLAKTGIRQVYLANFIPWDSRSFSEEMIQDFGALGSTNWRTFDTYDRIDDRTYMSVHDLLKQAIHGYSRVTDSLVREIRFGRIDKATAVEIARHYESEWPQKGLEDFCRWLEVDFGAFVWFLEKLGVRQQEKGRKALQSRARRFVKSFLAAGPSNATDSNYILFGKGVELRDEF